MKWICHRNSIIYWKTGQIIIIDMLVTIFFCDLPAICIYKQPLGDEPDQPLAEHLVCIDLLPPLLYHTLQMGFDLYLHLLHPPIEDWRHLLHWLQDTLFPIRVHIGEQSQPWTHLSNECVPTSASVEKADQVCSRQVTAYSGGWGWQAYCKSELWLICHLTHHYLLYFQLAEPAPGFAWENSTNHSLSSSTPNFPLSMSLNLTTHFAITIFVVTFGTGWSRHSPPLPSSWQWWQWAASWQVKSQLDLLGLSSSLSTSTDSFSSHRKLLISTGATQLSHTGLAIPIGIAIYDLCSKCNIQPQFGPQNSLVMPLCIACPSCWPEGVTCQKWARSMKNWEC